MTPFEDLINDLSIVMNINLHVDPHQSCVLSFLPEELIVQIDLDTNAERILIGSQLGRITPGPYRERIFRLSLRTNGNAKYPQGILAFSEKNDTLILFQFLELATLTGEKLYQFLQIFRKQANLWKMALSTGEVPHFLDENISQEKREGMFGMR